MPNGMTQKGQHSHFNVKFLKGYGFSVSVKDNKLVLKNNYDPFKESESEEWFINNLPYEKIALSALRLTSLSYSLILPISEILFCKIEERSLELRNICRT